MTTTYYTFGKTRYINGELDYAINSVDGLYLSRAEALHSARYMARYWKYNYKNAPDVKNASYRETDEGATVLVELKDGRNILTYFEVASFDITA